MRVTVEENNVLIFLKEISEASLVFISFKIRNCVEQTPVVIDVTLTEERVARGSIEEGVEIEKYSLVLILFKHRLKPILLFIGYKLDKGSVCIADLAEEDKYIAVSFFARIYEVISVVGNIENTGRLIFREYAYIDILFPALVNKFFPAIVITLAGENVEIVLFVILAERFI